VDRARDGWPVSLCEEGSRRRRDGVSLAYSIWTRSTNGRTNGVLYTSACWVLEYGLCEYDLWNLQGGFGVWVVLDKRCLLKIQKNMSIVLHQES
jgi:hypothetical protein